jgi:hypothetical protein
MDKPRTFLHFRERLPEASRSLSNNEIAGGWVSGKYCSLLSGRN